MDRTLPWIGRQVRHHPRITQAVKAAAAAMIAWLLVQPLWGVADAYPYYAPLGAVIAVSTTVAGSVRESLQGLLGIVLGSGVALAVGLLGLPEVVALGAVVAGGTLVAGWWRVGGKADWVPLTALFVLIIGKADAADYAVSYLGLTSLGAAVGIGVNLLFPPMPLTPTQASVTRVRELVAQQLDDLAEGLLHEEAPTDEEWASRQRAITPVTLQMRDMVGHATEARRGNWRAASWREEADRQYQQARALELLAFLVEELTAFVVAHESADGVHAGRETALGPQLRPYAAHAFQDMADALRSVESASADREYLVEAEAALDKLVEQVRVRRAESNRDLVAAGTLVMSLRRAIASLAPAPREAAESSRAA